VPGESLSRVLYLVEHDLREHVQELVETDGAIRTPDLTADRVGPCAGKAAGRQLLIARQLMRAETVTLVRVAGRNSAEVVELDLVATFSFGCVHCTVGDTDESLQRWGRVRIRDAEGDSDARGHLMVAG
jgi:hypothetical protein